MGKNDSDISSNQYNEGLTITSYQVNRIQVSDLQAKHVGLPDYVVQVSAGFIAFLARSAAACAGRTLG